MPFEEGAENILLAPARMESEGGWLEGLFIFGANANEQARDVEPEGAVNARMKGGIGVIGGTGDKQAGKT